jgi:hypothetical protein
MGREAFVDEQLHPTDASEPQILTLRLRGMVGEARDSGAWDLQDLPERDVLRQLSQAALLRAVYSHWQLRERLVDLWTNHFNIYARKNRGAYYTPTDQANVIRAHALGTFPDLLRASARSPAMLGYLDNEANRKGVPNENYARELLELHTLGVNGGYTQRDVREVARCLTGWTIEDRFLRRRGTFRFAAERHDNGEKIVLGHRIPAGGGEGDGERVLDIVCAHPSTPASSPASSFAIFWARATKQYRTPGRVAWPRSTPKPAATSGPCSGRSCCPTIWSPARLS